MAPIDSGTLLSPYSTMKQFIAPPGIIKMTLLRDDGVFLTKDTMTLTGGLNDKTTIFRISDENLVTRILVRYFPANTPPDDFQNIIGSGFFNIETQQFELSFADSYDPIYTPGSNKLFLLVSLGFSLPGRVGRNKTVTTEFKPSGTGRTYMFSDFEDDANKVGIVNPQTSDGHYEVKMPYATQDGGGSLDFPLATDNHYFDSPSILNSFTYPTTHVDCGATFSISVPHNIRYLASTAGFTRTTPTPSQLIVTGDGTDFQPSFSDPFTGKSITKVGIINTPGVEQTVITAGDLTGVDARFTGLAGAQECDWLLSAPGISGGLEVIGYVIELVAE